MTVLTESHLEPGTDRWEAEPQPLDSHPETSFHNVMKMNDMKQAYLLLF